MGKLKDVHSVYDKLIEEGHKPSRVTYTTIVSVLTRQKRFEAILPLLSEVEKNGIELNSIFFNAVINAFCESGSMDKAMTMFNKMKE